MRRAGSLARVRSAYHRVAAAPGGATVHGDHRLPAQALRRPTLAGLGDRRHPWLHDRGVGGGPDLRRRCAAVGPTGTRAELTVTGVFGQPDRGDPFWFGTQIPFPSPDSSELPPALFDRDGYLALSRRIGLTTEFAWDEYLDLYGRPFVEV